ncbi:MAG TPA: hypothetical protein VF669_09455 [Tepidisphaeraceae bacterium]|jgi:hypothetical protein
MKTQIDAKTIKEGKERAYLALSEFYRNDMRWSYIVIGIVIVVGIVCNIMWPSLWMMWPILFAVAVMSIVHEAAERNGQGVPPLYAYAFLFGFLALWVLVVWVMFKTINKYVLLFGLIGLGYQVAKAWVQERERNKIIEGRRAQGQCIFCGEVVEGKYAHCPNCGNEPDPTVQRMKRVASMVGGRKDAAHARAVMRPESNAASASKREQALLAKRAALRGQKPKR